MIALQYELTTYKKFLDDIAGFLGLQIIDNTLRFPEKIGSGYMKLIELPGDVEAILSHFRLYHDFLLERKKTDIEYYTFCCEELKEVTEFSMTIESDTFELKEDSKSAMYLTSFLYDVGYSLKSNSIASSVRVLLTPEWVKNHLGFDKKEETLQQYLELEQVRFENKFRFSVEPPAQAELLIEIPSMLVHPLVESALYKEVLKIKNEYGFLQVSFKKENTCMLVSIQYNSTEPATGIQARETNDSFDSVFKKLMERIELINYGKKAKISIEKKQLEVDQTLVTIKIPVND